MSATSRMAGLLVVVLVALASFGASLSGALGKDPGPTLDIAPGSTCASSVTLSAYDSLTWSATAIGPVCRYVNFTIVNTGSVQHTFTVSNQVNQSDPSSTSTAFFSWPDLYYSQDLNSSGSNGGTLTVPLAFGAPGAYEFTCIPHYSVGMHGTIYVEETPLSPAPAKLTTPGYWYLVAAVGGLAVLAVVGGIRFGRRHAPHEDARGEPSAEMDPEGSAASPPKAGG